MRDKKKRVSGRRVSTFLFVVYMIFVSYLCFGRITQPANLPTSLWGIPFDKYVHFLMFFPYAILAQSAFAKTYWWRTLTLVLISGIIVSIPFELLQTELTAYRTTEPWDMVTNMIAITCGALVMALAGIIREKKN